MLKLRTSPRNIIIHVLNWLLLGYLGYVLYYFQRNLILSKTTDINIHRNLINMQYWAVLIIVFVIYIIYYTTFRILFCTQRIFLKSVILGIECFVVFWLLLSLFHTFNFISLINDPVRRIPFVSYTTISFLLPFTLHLIRKLANKLGFMKNE
jgi:hypothetical protein